MAKTLSAPQSRHAIALTRSPKSFWGADRVFLYVRLYLGDVGAFFLERIHRPGLTPAYGLRRAKVGFGTDGGFFYVHL